MHQGAWHTTIRLQHKIIPIAVLADCNDSEIWLIRTMKQTMSKTEETVLVTGGAGYIGSHIVLDLLDNGFGVVVLDNLSRGVREAVPDGVPFYLGNTGDQDLVQSIFRHEGISAIVHMAAFISVPDSFADPVGYYRNNTASTLALVEQASAAGIRPLIFSSTAAVYGDDGIPAKHEGMMPDPATPYGKSKLYSEKIIVDAAAAGLIDPVALRYFNVAGADPFGRAGPASPKAADLMRLTCQTALGQHDGLTIFGTDWPTPDGTGIRDFIHVSDLASAHTAALRYILGGGEPLVANCGYGKGYSVREVIQAFTKAAGPFPVVEAAPRPGDLAHVISDPSLIREKLDWTPHFDDLETIVSHCLSWEKRLIGGQPRAVVHPAQKASA